MKIIFLDIDGVLVTFDSLLYYHAGKFSPEAVKQLNRIIDSTGAGLVITSIWRLGRDIQTLRGIFMANGIPGSAVIGRTPDSGSRGSEITEWLRKHSVDSFIIIDDDKDVGEHTGRLLRTKPAQGLTGAIADKAIRILGETPWIDRLTLI